MGSISDLAHSTLSHRVEKLQTSTDLAEKLRAGQISKEIKQIATFNNMNLAIQTLLRKWRTLSDYSLETKYVSAPIATHCKI